MLLNQTAVEPETLARVSSLFSTTESILEMLDNMAARESVNLAGSLVDAEVPVMSWPIFTQMIWSYTAQSVHAMTWQK